MSKSIKIAIMDFRGFFWSNGIKIHSGCFVHLGREFEKVLLSSTRKCSKFYKEKRLADPQDVTVAIWPSDKFITPEVILMLKLVIRVVSNPTRGII